MEERLDDEDNGGSLLGYRNQSNHSRATSSSSLVAIIDGVLEIMLKEAVWRNIGSACRSTTTKASVSSPSALLHHSSLK